MQRHTHDRRILRAFSLRRGVVVMSNQTCVQRVGYTLFTLDGTLPTGAILAFFFFFFFFFVCLLKKNVN
jgi:hypothetical protein